MILQTYICIPNKIRNIIKSTMTDSITATRPGREIKRNIQIKKAAGLGDFLSELLFTLSLNAVTKNLESIETTNAK